MTPARTTEGTVRLSSHETLENKKTIFSFYAVISWCQLSPSGVASDFLASFAGRIFSTLLPGTGEQRKR